MLLDRPGQMPALDRQSQISTPAWFEKSGARHLQSSRLCRAGYALVPLPASGNRGEVDVRMSPAISARRPQTLFWGRFFLRLKARRLDWTRQINRPINYNFASMRSFESLSERE